jgi:glycine oxidase
MSYDVAIVGGGIVGSAIALEVARRKARVVVVEREQPCRQASWAAAGMLSPLAEAHAGGPFLDLLIQARERFPALVAELESLTGIGLGYRTEGALLVATKEDEEGELEQRLAWQRDLGLEVLPLTGDEARRLEPALSAEVRSALHFPGDHQIDNRLLGKALWFAASAAGAEFRLGSNARRLDLRGRPAIELSNGDTIEAATVVIAAGSWSAQLSGLPRALPVEPVHGQLLSLSSTPPALRHIVTDGSGYLVPRSDGRVIVGATVERTGFRSRVTASGLNRLTSVAMELVPSFADLLVDAHWSGFRPGTPDLLPILGPDPDEPRVLYATGHYRNGILLGPITGQIIAAAALGDPQPIDLQPFSIARFGKS